MARQNPRATDFVNGKSNQSGFTCREMFLEHEKTVAERKSGDG
jgi:hypothetical protein